MVKAFKQYENYLMEKLVVWFQAALDFVALVGFFEETNRNVSKIHNRTCWLIIYKEIKQVRRPDEAH